MRWVHINVNSTTTKEIHYGLACAQSQQKLSLFLSSRLQISIPHESLIIFYNLLKLNQLQQQQTLQISILSLSSYYFNIKYNFFAIATAVYCKREHPLASLHWLLVYFVSLLIFKVIFIVIVIVWHSLGDIFACVSLPPSYCVCHIIHQSRYINCAAIVSIIRRHWYADNIYDLHNTI